MTVDEVVKHFGSLYMVEKKTEFSHSTAYSWKKNGFIPIKTQMKIEEITGGLLKANLEDCK